jgi:hypothetical protein
MEGEADGPHELGERGEVQLGAIIRQQVLSLEPEGSRCPRCPLLLLLILPGYTEKYQISDTLIDYSCKKGY